jgi:hypothetical protein
MFTNWQRKTIALQKIASFFISYFAVVGVGMLMGNDTQLFIDLTYYSVTIPLSTAYILVMFTLVSLLLTRLKPKNGPYALMMIVLILVMFHLTPLGEMVPQVAEVGKFVRDWFHTGGYRAMWLGAYLGLIGVMVRVFFGRERMRMAG